MTYFTPDLSGTSENYKVDNDIYRLYVQGQKIVFENSPIFLHTLNISFLSDANAVLVNGVDWEAQVDDIDYTQMSKAKKADPSFAFTLLKSITIIRDLSGGEIDVNMSYQKFFPVVYKTAFGLEGTVDLTPELLIDMLGRINNMETAIGIAGSPTVSPSQISARLLDFDQHGTNPNNLIEEEPHTVNTFNHLNLIRPAQGAFFKDSVVVSITDTEEVLVEGVDYVIVGFNRAHTKETQNTSGVYDFIHITRAMALEVLVTYHAVGGDVTVADMDAVVKELNNVTEYLGTRSFLTPQSLASSTPYQTLANKIITLEDKMRILAASGTPSYGDSTNGQTVVKQLQAADIQPHWYTIAELYQVEGSNDIFVSDRARFRMKLVGAKLMADVTVAVDLTMPRDKLIVTSSNVVQDLKYELFGASEAGAVVMPQFRIIWNDEGGSPLSGIFLQIGVALPGLTDTLAIEDYSGIQSAWKFLPSPGTPEAPADDSVVLPDGASNWDTLSASSFSLIKTMPTQKPYRAWEGATAVSALDLSNDLTHLLPNNFLIHDVKNIVLMLRDTANGNRNYSVKIPMVKTDEDTIYGQADLVGTGAADVLVLAAQLVNTAGVITLNVGSNGAALASYDDQDLLYVLVEV